MHQTSDLGILKNIFIFSSSIFLQLNVSGLILAVEQDIPKKCARNDLMNVWPEKAVRILNSKSGQKFYWYRLDTYYFISGFIFSVDYQICKNVDDDPQAYLVPHPDDCTKFYSCQNLGWRGGYIAHLMDCPPTTGFDTKLRICNYIRALPRCNKGNIVVFI